MANWGTPGHLTLTYKIWSDHSNDCTSTNFVPLSVYFNYNCARIYIYTVNSSHSQEFSMAPQCPISTTITWGPGHTPLWRRGHRSTPPRTSESFQQSRTNCDVDHLPSSASRRPQERPRYYGKKISHHGCNFLPTDMEPKLTSNHFFSSQSSRTSWI